jgi:PIF1-like helicase/Helix-turn-helix domain/Helicase
MAARCIQQTNRSLFLTGKAGTGKTTFLKSIIGQTHKNAIVVAPTGVAAINAGGATIHSVFQLPFGMFIPEAVSLPQSNLQINNPVSLLRHLQMGEKKRNMLRELELLVIDEVSMLRADLLDAIDHVLRYIRKKNHLPFGGVQVLFIGDLLQLPPVVKDMEWNILKQYYKSIYFFDARVFEQEKPLFIELKTIYRQSDLRFIELLNNLRTNTMTEADAELLNGYYRPAFRSQNNDHYITLTTHNYKADELNQLALQKISSPSCFFEAVVEGDFNESAFPVDKKLELRLGAQVMFVKNDLSGQQLYFNGKIGTVVELDKENISVLCEGSDEPLEVEPYVWKNVRYVLNETTNTIEESVLGTFTQYPLKLAWAITVHKSQGLTFDKAIIDIGDAFASGQSYVALSRLRSLDGLILASPLNLKGVQTDQYITDYTESGKLNEDELEGILQSEKLKYLNRYLMNTYDLSGLCAKFQYHRDSYTKEENRSEKQKYHSWAVELTEELFQLRVHADKFQQLLEKLLQDTGQVHPEMLDERTRSAAAYFLPRLETLSKKIIGQLKEIRSDRKIKKFQTELTGLEAAIFAQIQKIRKSVGFLDAVKNNTDFNRETSGMIELNKERLRVVVQESTIRKRKNRQPTHTEERTEKIPSRDVSFQLYTSGLSIGKIAEQRQMAISTIEGHLADQVAKGLLEATAFVAADKIDAILEVARKKDTVQLGEIRQFLGDEFSYADIRMAVAHKRYIESAKKE